MRQLIEEMQKRRSLFTANANQNRGEIERLQKQVKELEKTITSLESQAEMYDKVIEALKAIAD